jgi:protein-S-isoprenylcysteine O-methyltransferase Ste14
MPNSPIKKTAWDYGLVGIQGLLGLAYLLPVGAYWPEALPQTPGWVAVLAIGLGLFMGGNGLWQIREHLSPFPSPKAHAQLVTDGAYALVRHPIYTGIVLILAGYALYTSHAYRLAITGLLLLLFYFKSGYEERKLQAMFSEYRWYKKRVGRLWPRLPWR